MTVTLMRTGYVLVFGALLLGGCTSQQEYLERLSTYKGMTEAQLIDSRGVPTNSYEVDGRKYLSYVTTRVNDYGPSTGVYGGMGGGGGFGGIGTGVVFGTPGGGYSVRSCENTFVIFKGRVEKVGYKGQCL